MKKEESYMLTLKMLDFAKKTFERKLEKKLNLIKIPCPLFVKTTSGLQDNLTGHEKAISFTKGKEKFEIVHSLAKWKREVLGKYKIPVYGGIYTDMKAIRKDEVIDNVHSLYVEQWDWEKVILKDDRTLDYLKDTVKRIYKCIKDTSHLVRRKCLFLNDDLPSDVYFITSQELEDLYPDKIPTEREQLITKKKGVVFIIGIGDKLSSGRPHDLRSPDYDDWSLDGDLLIYFKKLDKAVEVLSMGIRVDDESLVDQLKKADAIDRIKLPYHQNILKSKLPYTIGGGIGLSRILMLFLEKEHISEVQASSWEENTIKEISKYDYL